MNILLDIKDSKADFFLELIKSFSFVKVKSVDETKEEVLEGLRKSIEQVRLAEQGKIKLKSAYDLLNEL